MIFKCFMLVELNYCFYMLLNLFFKDFYILTGLKGNVI